VKVIAPEALELLGRRAWPGNVRELQNVLERALIEATGPVLLPEFLEPALAQRPAAALPTDAPADELAPFIEERLRAGSEDLYGETLRRMERLLLTHVLQHTGGNQLKAAQLLGITRGSLRTKLRDLGITIARHVARPEAAD
jgi:two-component system nitrogen regulation response regulator GlnG